MCHCVLQWGESLQDHTFGPKRLHPDFIFGSDITYDENQFLPLLQTIAAYAKHNSALQVQLLLSWPVLFAAYIGKVAMGFAYKAYRVVTLEPNA